MAHGYVHLQLAKALQTAAGHEDPETRARADARVADWVRTMQAIDSGAVTVGSRSPLRGFPAWVTPEVLRGGFATGEAEAAGPLTRHERERARRHSLPERRDAVFASYLTDEGMAELQALLAGGNYRIGVPEEAALLVVAALLRAGHRGAALELLEELSAYAGQLRFTPQPDRPPRRDSGQVFRRTVDEVSQALRTVRAEPRIEAQREALTVWLPLTDKVVEFWVTHAGEPSWSPATAAQAQALVDEYDRACADHARCTKYRNPKHNLAILVAVLRDSVGRTPSQAGLARVRHVISCIRAKRGLPSEESCRSLRSRQAADAARPSHDQLAQVAIRRLEARRADEGIPDPGEVSRPVAERESSRALPAGTPMPEGVRRKIWLGWSATLPDLIAGGVVPSAEVIAELLPAITAEQVAAGFPDPQVGRLMGACYEAFRRRRSLLLVNLASQVRFEELPWVRRASLLGGRERVGQPGEVARWVAALSLDSFPGTILPNPFISELATLFQAGEEPVTLTEELAADIFMSQFAPKFLAAAHTAARLLRGSLYERYYGLDYGRVLTLSTPAEFGALCGAEAIQDKWSITGNRRVIERAQVLTTHNLAALVTAGVTPSRPWADLAVEAAQVCARSGRLARDPRNRPRAIKDAAYAWRQAVFFCSMADPSQMPGIVSRMAGLAYAQEWPLAQLRSDLEGCWGGERVEPFFAWTPGSRREPPGSQSQV
ncbi:MAG: hypothetical protein Q3997_02375 [Propionibacteriaceae bacterium]|nr:hypothetical protein [Propionibacteriaceae bacterium]